MVDGRRDRNRGGRRRPALAPGTLVTATVVAQARKGVTVEVAGVELLLPRTRWGTAGWLHDAGYGDAVTVEAVAGGGPGGPGGAGAAVGLSRVGIERSFRQPREIAGRFRWAGGPRLEPDDGSPPFPVVLLDQLDPASFDGQVDRWSVGAPFLGVRLIARSRDLA